MSPPAAAGAGAAAAAEPDAAAPLQWAGTSAAECRRTVEHVTKRDPTVRFLFDKLEEVRRRRRRRVRRRLAALPRTLSPDPTRL
jgi:hypothetical protein